MSYRIDFTSSAAKELRRLEPSLQRRIIRKIEALADDPRPSGCRKLVGSQDCYCIRIGDYRVVYELNDGTLTILILRVRHRRHVYE